MHEEENIALVRRGMEAGMKGDYDTLRPLLSEDVSYLGPFQPEVHGADKVIATMKKLDERAAELGLSWEQEYEGFWADESRVVLLQHLKVSRDSQTLDTHEVEIVELKNGKASRITEYASEPEKLAELMS